MKKLSGIKLAILSFAVFGLFINVSCSDETSEIKNDGIMLESPTGEILAASLDDIAKFHLGDPEATITAIDYIIIPGRKKGFVAEIFYQNSNDKPSKAMIIRGLEKFNFNGSINLLTNEKSSGDITVTCTGLGCCYVSGTMSIETGSMTFDCKCEGNPDLNSSCTMTVRQR